MRYFDYTASIFTRIRILNILKNDFLSVIKDVIRDHEDYEGFPVPNTSSLKLMLIYKQYLDTIYNIMENVSRFNCFYLQKDMSQNFTEQCKKNKENKYSIPERYRNIIKWDLEWYQEVHLIRSNMNHFLIGDYDVKRTEKGQWIFKYENINKSKRGPHVDKTHSIERNMLEDIEEFQNSFFNF
ncbi:hypothetical protein [Methanohalophilus profundi]|uniref:hypothetical protein n=1 Tax=Methanohalophilus profundi TaxID=2138083 RepID=UPI0013EA891B|nr:hypothetical protein [Methanohalophilus profundi]